MMDRRSELSVEKARELIEEWNARYAKLAMPVDRNELRRMMVIGGALELSGYVLVETKDGLRWRGPRSAERSVQASTVDLVNEWILIDRTEETKARVEEIEGELKKRGMTVEDEGGDRVLTARWRLVKAADQKV